MNNPELENFYLTFVLPAFEVDIQEVMWKDSARLEGDEYAFWFSSGERKYLLLWIDYQEAGLTAADVESLLQLDAKHYTFVMPRDKRVAPSFQTPPWKYEEKFVGWFTLLELH